MPLLYYDPYIEINLDNPNICNRLHRFGNVVCRYGRDVDWYNFIVCCNSEYNTDNNYIHQNIIKDAFPQLNINWLINGKYSMLVPLNDNRLQFLFDEYSKLYGASISFYQPSENEILRLINGSLSFSCLLQSKKLLNRVIDTLGQLYFSNKIKDVKVPRNWKASSFYSIERPHYQSVQHKTLKYQIDFIENDIFYIHNKWFGTLFLTGIDRIRCASNQNLNILK